MEQRSLRLGDIVDDYCPRERRVTNHAIVALVGDSIRQTRCSTCDAEHEYKEGRVPRKKSLKNGSDLSGGVLVTPRSTANGQAQDDAPAATGAPAEAASTSPGNGEVTDPDTAPEAVDGESRDSETMPDGWLAHRPLIRATLPRTENDVPPPRAIPEFTMHQRQGRGFGARGFRPSHSFGGHGANGNGSQPSGRDGNTADGNRAGARPGGKSRHRRRHRRPR